MEFFRFDTVGNLNPEHCFIDQNPEGIEFKYARLSTGEPLKDEYPTDQSQITLKFGEDYPGIETPFFIGNAGDYLIFHKQVKEIFAKFKLPELEYLPFTLINHKNRVASTDYVFVNPLGAYDCLDYNETEIESTDGVTIGYDNLTILNDKLNGAPDLFRIKDIPFLYLFSRPLAEAMIASEYTSNLNFLPVNQN